MLNLVKLREEHAQLVSIVRRLSEEIGQDKPGPSAELHVLRRELSSTLIRHLKAEDWILYPKLLGSSDTAVVATARKFNDEMGGLAAAFMAYSEKWGPLAIERDWAGYREETATIADALTQRITRENRELYPLLERFDRAA